jgi:flagellar capping protein FliD
MKWTQDKLIFSKNDEVNKKMQFFHQRQTKTEPLLLKDGILKSTFDIVRNSNCSIHHYSSFKRVLGSESEYFVVLSCPVWF